MMEKESTSLIYSKIIYQFYNSMSSDEAVDVSHIFTKEFLDLSLFKHSLYINYFKRLIDILLCMVVFILFGWLFILIALIIKFDDPSAPVLFRQERVGFNGSLFCMYKFRTMCVDAEKRLDELSLNNEKDGPVFKIKADPRVTRVGRFLRMTSLDELPQFINVMRGDISIVGPRPALPSEVRQYDEYQRMRLLIKPGITCFWQTRKQRDLISFDDWVNLDLVYICNCNLFNDIRILFKTIIVVLTAQGA